MWDATNRGLEGKCISENTFIGKQETLKIKEISIQLKEIMKEKRSKSKEMRRKHRIKIIVDKKILEKNE